MLQKKIVNFIHHVSKVSKDKAMSWHVLEDTDKNLCI